MTDEEKKRLLQLIFTEIRADHVDGRLAVNYKVRPEWEPYVEAVLARRRVAEAGSSAVVVTSERKTGVKHAEVVTGRLVQDERG